MKKFFSVIIGFAVLFGIFSLPAVSKGTTALSTQELIATLQAQITALNQQITNLNVQLEAVKQAQSQVKETAKDVKGTLQLLNQLKFGMSSDEVKQLQELLATDSDIYPEGYITGFYGRLTEQAVKRFQKKVCLDQVGAVGPKTLSKINELLTEGAGNSGKIPPGLLIAPGIQKKLCATTTPDTTFPVISGVIATSTTATTTQIEWLTDELANSKVWHATTTPVVEAISTLSVSSADYVLNHVIGLSGLTASTTYYYLAASTDNSGNMATATQASFTTLGE